MGANTTYYVKLPVIAYRWEPVSALTKQDAIDQYPNAIEVKHLSEYETD